MSDPRSQPTPPLPAWLTLAGSTVVVTHLFILGALVLAAPSGPWPAPNGTAMANGPQFAQNVNETTAPNYLRPLKMSHNYHFRSNRAANPAVRLEVQLQDAEGNVTETLQLPDPNANATLRHRQALMVQMLADDQFVEPPTGETIAAPGQEVKTVAIWDFAGPQELALKRVPEHLVPRDRQVMRPSEWSLILVRSYARHLCRTHGAASAVVIRHTREPIHPNVLGQEEPAPGMFADLVCNFGEFSR